MKTSLISYVLMGFLAMVVLPLQLVSQDAGSILKKTDALMFAAKDQQADIRLVLTDSRGNQRTREAQTWQKGTDKRLFRFTAPAAEAGIAFLSLPGDITYLYMPAFGRERRIASHVRNQSFAGTDFSYEDMEARAYYGNYEARITGSTPTATRLELVPKPHLNSDYSRLVVEINQTHFYPESTQAYDRGGNLVKRAVYTWDKQDSFWYPSEIAMEDLRRNHSTRMQMTRVQFNTGMDDQVFTVRNLTGF